MLDRAYPAPMGRPPPYNGLPAEGSVGPPHSYVYGYGEAEPQESLNPLRLLLYVFQYRWLIATMAIVGLVAGFVVTMMQTPKYEASSRVEVMAPSARVFQDMEVVSESSDLRAFLTARERLRSRALAQRVVYQLGLSERPDFLFPAPDFSFINIINRAFRIKTQPELEEQNPEERERIAIARVRDGLSVELVTDTSLVEVTFRDQNADYASEIANQVAQSYIDQRVDQIGETSELARQFIQDQVLQIKDKLQKSEQALNDYAKEAGITITGDQKSLISSNIEAINTALAKAIEERLDYELLVQQIEVGRGASLERVLASEGLQKLQGDIAALSGEYQQKLSTFKPGFPEMRQLSARIGELTRQYESGVAVITDGIRHKHDETVAKETDLRKKLSELEDQQVAFQDKNIQYTILKREVDSNRSQYDTLISKLNEVGVGSELRSQNAAIVDHAVTPRWPVSPRLLINVAFAFALFMALSATLIYILELLNNTFVNPDQVEKELGLPVMGILPLVDGREFASNIADPQSGLSEAYRTLRTSLQFSGSEGAPKSLLVTSAEPSEGKSTTTFKLAQDFAALGNKVVVIDGDLRKPNIHRLFALDNTLGLSNILTNTARREDMPRTIRKVKDRNIWVISSGTIPPNPADLLSSTKMAMIVEHLTTRFDVVLIDAPPIIGLSDAPILGRLTQGTLLVVASNQVSRKAAKAALKRMRAAGANAVGAVLSKFEVGKFDYNYAYRYMNYYYYSYGSESPKLEGPNGEPEVAAVEQEPAVHRLGRRLRASLVRFTRRLKPVS